MTVRNCHHTESEGLMCPGEDRPVFVTHEHFLDKHDGRCHLGHTIADHRPALRVIDIYVEEP